MWYQKSFLLQEAFLKWNLGSEVLFFYIKKKKLKESIKNQSSRHSLSTLFLQPPQLPEYRHGQLVLLCFALLHFTDLHFLQIEGKTLQKQKILRLTSLWQSGSAPAAWPRHASTVGISVVGRTPLLPVHTAKPTETSSCGKRGLERTSGELDPDTRCWRILLSPPRSFYRDVAKLTAFLPPGFPEPNAEQFDIMQHTISFKQQASL